MLTVSTRTHPGTVRQINEDSMLWDPEVALVAVADGMGGHNAGEVASQLALDAIRAFLKKSLTGDFTWPFGVKPTLSFAANRLMTGIKIANRRVFKESERSADYTGMGTTVAAAIVDGPRLALCGVGDSRIYSFDGSVLRQLTIDDTWVILLSQDTGLPPATFANHPMRRVLTSVVGAKPDLEVTVHDVEIVDGATLMMCTDGLHGALDDDDIAAVLRAEPDLERAAEGLVKRAVDRDGSDNVTVALARYTSG